MCDISQRIKNKPILYYLGPECTEHSGPICAFAHHFAAVRLEPMPLLFEFHFQEIERKLKSDQILAEMGFEPGNSGPESRVLTTILWRNLIQNAQKVTWNPSANFGSNFLLL